MPKLPTYELSHTTNQIIEIDSTGNRRVATLPAERYRLYEVLVLIIQSADATGETKVALGEFIQQLVFTFYED